MECGQNELSVVRMPLPSRVHMWPWRAQPVSELPQLLLQDPLRTSWDKHNLVGPTRIYLSSWRSSIYQHMGQFHRPLAAPGEGLGVSRETGSVPAIVTGVLAAEI